MKKLPIILFILIAGSITFYAVFRNIHPKTEQRLTGAQTIEPIAPGSTPEKKGEQNITVEPEILASYIPLNKDETLINSYTVDFDKDNYDDQIISIRKSSSLYISIIVGIYNPIYDTYERAITLETTIDQVQTFSFYVQDITGTHTNTLIITGFDDKNNSIMQVYMPSQDSKKLELTRILDLAVDGTIFVQQMEQPSSYDLGQTDGISFPVWVYMPDPNASAGSLDQIQVEYVWNKSKYTYEKNHINYITGKSITAKELRKIQDGTVETFAGFLDGLWQKTSSTDKEIRYISFAYDKKLIDFAKSDVQEIYTWSQSTLRRNGIILVLNNSDITSLIRRVDLTLVSTEEINIKIADNLGFKIGTDPLWDGNYKKVTNADISKKLTTTNTTKTQGKEAIDTLLAEQKKDWKTDNGYTISFDQDHFTAIAQEKDIDKETFSKESGVLSRLDTPTEQFLQLRTTEGLNVFTDTYRVTMNSIDSNNKTTIQIKIIPITIRTSLAEEKKKQPIVLSRTITIEAIN